MIISAHQPEYLIWLGYIWKMKKADKFVILDHVQFKKNNFQNSNYIRGPNGKIKLTIPIKTHKLDTPINNIMIDNTKNWRKKHWKSIQQAYEKSPFWDAYSGFFKELYEEEWNYLADITTKIIGYMAACFNITTPIYRSIAFKFKKQKTDLLIEMTKHFKCDAYLSGLGAKDYIEEEKFKKANIKLILSDFKHPEYKQMFDGFIPNMSAIDLLFNYGLGAKKILFGDE